MFSKTYIYVVNYNRRFLELRIKLPGLMSRPTCMGLDLFRWFLDLGHVASLAQFTCWTVLKKPYAIDLKLRIENS